MVGLEAAAEREKESALSVLDSCDEDLSKGVANCIKNAYIAGASYAIENMWQKADGDYLPEIDREVIALQRCFSGYRVVFAHRPNPKGYVMVDGKKLTIATHDKGGWNIEDIEFWLDLDLPLNQKEL